MNKNDGDEVLYHAGFPNAGEELRAGSLNLDALIVRRRASTFFWRLESSVDELSWPAGTLIVVDRSLPPREGKLVVAVVDEVFTLVRYYKTGFKLLHGTKITTAQLWGCVTYAIQEVY